MKKIDLNTWKRKSHYEWFSAFANPCFSITSRLDITNLLEFCEKNGTSSFATVMYSICKCLNGIQPFKYRVLNGEVYEIAYANVAYTVNVSNDYFVNNRTITSCDYLEFCSLVKKETEAIRKRKDIQQQFNNTAIIDDIYCSCLPWIDFLSIEQPIPDFCPENSCIPRVCWGKYINENDKIMISITITASHALVDGRDMSMAFISLQNIFDNPEKYLLRGIV